MIKHGLLGYQPIFFPNGVISGTGLQFFGNLHGMRASESGAIESGPEQSQVVDFKTNDATNFNKGRLGNLYIPQKYGDRSEFDSEFYYCVDENDAGTFAKYNLALLDMYKHFSRKSLELIRENGITVDSMIEVGANTCLFPLAFAESGVEKCHGADIVDYSNVVNLLAGMHNANIDFHYMKDDSDATWGKLPKSDLVWSYAVIVHQSNPLAHLTRLASLAKRAMFVMTLCDSGRVCPENEMAIRYLSANTYYNADFPNCFDVTIVSPELIKYSLKRLGFSKVIEIPHPTFSYLEDWSQRDLKHWARKHCFYLALRDEAAQDVRLNDFSIDTERNPYKGQVALVHSGYHHNIILIDSKYVILPHGKSIDHVNEKMVRYASLNRAMAALLSLDAEMSPHPVTEASDFSAHRLIRFRSKVYFVKNGRKFDWTNESAFSDLPVLNKIETWNELSKAATEEQIAGFRGLLVDYQDGFCILRQSNGGYTAGAVSSVTSPVALGGLMRLFSRAGGPKAPGKIGPVLSAPTLPEIKRKIAVQTLNQSMDESDGHATLYRAENGLRINRELSGEFTVSDEFGRVVSKHTASEDAWAKLFHSIKGSC